MSKSLNDSRVAGGWNVRARLDTSAGLMQQRVPSKHRKPVERVVRVVADQEVVCREPSLYLCSNGSGRVCLLLQGVIGVAEPATIRRNASEARLTHPQPPTFPHLFEEPPPEACCRTLEDSDCVEDRLYTADDWAEWVR